MSDKGKDIMLGQTQRYHVRVKARVSWSGKAKVACQAKANYHVRQRHHYQRKGKGIMSGKGKVMSGKGKVITSDKGKQSHVKQ